MRRSESLPSDLEFIPIISVNYEHKKLDQLIIILDLWLTLTSMVFINRIFYRNFIFVGSSWRLLLLPLFLYGLVWEFLFVSMFFSALIYHILRLIEPPKQGIFDIKGREFRYYCLRFWVAYYILYIARAMPVPWADMIVFPIFGSKIGKNVVLYDSWIDPEFIEVGDSCMLSLNTQIYSSVIYQDKFYVFEVILEKNAIAGGGSIVAPGTYFEEGAILGAKSRTNIGQRLGGYMIHVGNPAIKSIPIKLSGQKAKKKEGPINE